MSTNTQPYTFGLDMAAPFTVTLTINTEPLLDIEQFKADLPRIMAKLESYVVNAKDEAARRGQSKTAES